jgi:cell division protein ZapA
LRSGRSEQDLKEDSIRVNIFNQTYSLRSANGDGEHVRRVAQLVDERMRSIASQLAVHDIVKVAVLAALNLADELEVLKDSFERELSALLMSPLDEEAVEARSETQDELQSEPQSSVAELLIEPPTDNVVAEDQAWFDSIFDPETSVRGGERLSTQVSSRLKSHVSARLRRLRQPAPKPAITEDTGSEH